MFERDKAELRELGIPLETGRNSHFDSEDGYRIRRGDYELPPIEFDAAEAAAVGLAARLWQSATLGEAARSALIKLRAAGTEVHAADAPGAVPLLDASDPSLPTLLEAARTATVVSFDYRKVGAEIARAANARTLGRAVVAPPLVRRRLRPRPRRAAQLPAVAGSPATSTAVGKPGAFERPEKVDLLEMVAGGWPDDERRAQVQVSGSGAGQLRRIAESEIDGVLTISFSDPSRLARIIAGAGAGARVLSPPDLVDAVVERLRAAAGGA